MEVLSKPYFRLRDSKIQKCFQYNLYSQISNLFPTLLNSILVREKAFTDQDIMWAIFQAAGKKPDLNFMLFIIPVKAENSMCELTRFKLHKIKIFKHLVLILPAYFKSLTF